MENSLELLLKYPRIVTNSTADPDTIAIQGKILVNVSFSFHIVLFLKGLTSEIH